MRIPVLILTLAAGTLLAACSSPRDAATPRAPTAAADRADARTAPPPPPQRPIREYVQGTDPITEAALRDAIEAFEQAEFEDAAPQFARIADNTSAPDPLRADAMRYLGRVQVALGQNEAAVETMVRLIELEPPIIELDPDLEPPPLMQTYYEARREADGDYAVRSGRPQTLAIVNFTNSSITDKDDWDPMQQGFASLMIHAMGPATDLKLVERERIRWLLDEQNLQRDPSLIDQATAVRAGRLLGAQTVIFGSFIVNRRDLLISARLVDVETGEILFSEQARGRAENFDQLVESLSLQVARTLNVDLASADVETRSLDAALSYSEGLALVEQGDYEGAHRKFLQALDYDPNYSRARQRVHSLRPLLASR
jgi:tetratricopeptide (TPR) repeat protein